MVMSEKKKTYMRKYWAKNKEKCRRQRREQHNKHRKKRLYYHKKHYQQNKEKITKHHHEHYVKNKKAIKARIKKWREKNPEKFKKAIKTWRGSQKGKETIAARDARRNRNLKWIKLMNNPFPKEVVIHWHHIHDWFVFPVPVGFHMNSINNRIKHRQDVSSHIKYIFGLDVNELLKGERK